MPLKYFFILISLILLMTTAYSSNAQSSQITLSEKHLRKLDKIKDGHKRLVKFHKFYKRDSLAFVRKSLHEEKLKGIANNLADSLRDKSPLNVTIESKRYSGLARSLKDSSAHDSLQRNLETLFEGKTGYDTLDLSRSFQDVGGDTLNQMLTLPRDLDDIAELNQLDQNMPDMNGLVTEPLQDVESLKSELSELPQSEIPKLPKAELPDLPAANVTDLSKKAAALPLFSELSPVIKARETVSKLLSKYRNYSNSNDLSDATKANSLKGKTFSERLVFSSDFNMVSIQPLSLDLTASVAFRFSQRFLSGLGGTYRLTMKDSIESVKYISPSNIGLKFHLAYDILRNTYLYGEASNTKASIQDNDRVRNTWVYKYSVGLGRRIVIAPKLYLTTTIIYALNYRDQAALYANRFQVRVGFQTTELANKKSKVYYNPNE